MYGRVPPGHFSFPACSLKRELSLDLYTLGKIDLSRVFLIRGKFISQY